MTPPKIYGLVGYPIEHSLSPDMHNEAFKKLGINAEYRLFEVPPEKLEGFLLNDAEVKDTEGRKVCAKDLQGFNVTMPYKTKILEFVELDDESKSFYLREIEAVNTIKREGNRLIGFNTDIPGFTKHLKEQFNPANSKTAILGAGGASRAVAYALAKSGVKEIVVFDIDRTKTNKVVSIIKRSFTNFKIYGVDSIEQLNLEDKDLLVNATPIGMKETDPCLIDERLIHNNLFVYDLIYWPKETKLLKLAKNKGKAFSNGAGMLLYQAVLTFVIWNDKQIDDIMPIMREALIKGLKNRERYG